MNLPKAEGLVPTDTSVTTVFVVVSITETELLPEFAA
jgi:hypothetical protein